MRSSIIAFLFMCSFSNSTFAQWYNDKYGVDELKDLTDAQLMESYSNAKKASWGGGVITVTGYVLIVSGAVEVLWTTVETTVNLFTLTNPQPETWGGGLLIAGAAMFISGSVLWIHGGSRKKQLKPIMRTRDLFSNISIYPGAGYEKMTDTYFPSLTLRIEF